MYGNLAAAVVRHSRKYKQIVCSCIFFLFLYTIRLYWWQQQHTLRYKIYSSPAALLPPSVPRFRPARGQRAYYNGHKRKYALDFQGVVTPDGIFVHLFGPVEGTRYDAYIFDQSGLLPVMHENMNGPEGEPYSLYGDPGYRMDTHFSCPYQAASKGPLTPSMTSFNERMSHCRVAVEWGLKEMSDKWAFVNNKQQQNIILSPVGVQTE